MTDEIMAYEPRKLQNPGVIEAFGAAVMAVGVRRVAGKLRKAESTLYGELCSIPSWAAAPPELRLFSLAENSSASS